MRGVLSRWDHWLGDVPSAVRYAPYTPMKHKVGGLRRQGVGLFWLAWCVCVFWEWGSLRPLHAHEAQGGWVGQGLGLVWFGLVGLGCVCVTQPHMNNNTQY